MTATLDYRSRLVSELISSCLKAREGYRLAADLVEDAGLKRLFEIYAQQRSRFAKELTAYLPLDEADMGGTEMPFATGERVLTRQESIRECLTMDARTLALYKEAIAQRTLPTRAHFLISAQLALLQQVYDRMRTILNEKPAVRPPMQVRVSA